MKLDPQSDAEMRQFIRDALRAHGQDPYDAKHGITAEDFILGGPEFRKWAFESEAAMYSRVGMNEGVIKEPLGEGIPGEQPPEIEAQCISRAELLFLRLMLPERFLNPTTPIMAAAVYGPFRENGETRPAAGEEVRRILWLRILMADGAYPLSERCKAALKQIQHYFRPGVVYDLDSPEALVEWQSWLCSFECSHPEADRILRGVKRIVERLGEALSGWR